VVKIRGAVKTGVTRLSTPIRQTSVSHLSEDQGAPRMYVGTPLISKQNVSASASGGVLSGSLTRRTVLNPMDRLKELCCCADRGPSTCDMLAVTVMQYRRRVTYPAGHQSS